MPRTRIDVEAIRAAHEVIARLNRLDLAEVDFYEGGELIEPEPGAVGDWEFTGLNNRDYVLMEGWKAATVDGEIPPSEAARAACAATLSDASGRFEAAEGFPVPQVSAGGNGDVICEWHGGNRKVVASFSEDGSCRLHVFAKENHRTVSVKHVASPDPGAFADVLRWFQGPRLAIVDPIPPASPGNN